MNKLVRFYSKIAIVVMPIPLRFGPPIYPRLEKDEALDDIDVDVGRNGRGFSCRRAGRRQSGRENHRRLRQRRHVRAESLGDENGQR